MCMATGKGIDIMNWYSVQYADGSGMVSQWAQADTHLCAAADVMIDRGFMSQHDADDDTPIMVVRRHDYIAGSYTSLEVELHANRILGLT